jgi:hypothetical protein
MPYRQKRDDALTWLLAASPLPTGIVIAGFSDRFTSRAWRFAAGVPYSVWAGILLMCGAVMLGALLLPPRGPKREAVLLVGMALSGLWWFVLGAVFLYTAIVDPLANPLGVVAWWTIGSCYAIWCWYERRRPG